MTILPSLPWPALVERWRQVEALGFDSVWGADHFVNPYHPADDWFEGWTLLAGLAAQTSSIRVGVLVTTITFRNPAVLARQALTVDHISNGRLELGLGAGGRPLDHSMTGVAAWTAAERVGRFREVVEIVDRLLRNEVTTYRGRYYQIQEARMHPAPIQRPRPPLTIAAHGARMIEIAAAHADTWNSYGGLGISLEAAVEATRQRGELLDERCAALGRDPRGIGRSLMGGFVPHTPGTPFASVDAFHDFVGRYRAAGIDEFIFHWPRPADLPIFERIAHEVIPAMWSRGIGR